MSFYLKPPRGLINFHTLEECVEERLTCYESLDSNKVEIKNPQYLIEDSALDRTGHFVFRLAAYKYSSFSRIFIDSEVQLFERRLHSYDQCDIKSFLKRLLRQAKECDDANEVSGELKYFYETLQEICVNSLNKDFQTHVYGSFHLDTEYCENYTLKVPFIFCRSLVAARIVDLNYGCAVITCQLWKKMLSSLYETHLLLALKTLEQSMNVKKALADDRIRLCLKSIKSHYFRSVTHNMSTFALQNIDEEVNYFPLCMKNLYEVLRKNHRLSHDARFEFSLYLKGIGLSLDDSIKFWEDEYSKDHASCSKCSHYWQQNEKKYLYGIRHLYGLEGSRRDYTMKSCDFLQNKCLAASDEGGCPFVHFDDDNLKRCLQKSLDDKDAEIEVIIHKRRKKPSESCKLFYNLSMKNPDNTTESDKCFINPVQYYMSFKGDIR